MSEILEPKGLERVLRTPRALDLVRPAKELWVVEEGEGWRHSYC